ncbi:MAG: S-layer protein domain-containing protein [Candidatus Methanoperedens sp.]|nr:S-layer protein domain-containing protein [Candidatus Methanoperedens sp.]
MIKILTVLVLTSVLAIPAMAANVTKVEVHGVVFDEKSSAYNTTLLWDAQNFTGFWYASGGGKSSETLRIEQPASSLTANSREIRKEKLLYNTSRTDQKYVVFTEKDKQVENGLEYNSTTRAFTKSTKGGYYARLGWFGDQYVAVNGKANKLARLVKEQKKDEKQTLKLGASWNLGDSYNLTVEALDTKTSPRQAWLSLSRNGTTLDNKVVNEGEVYTYIEKSLDGESNVPVFATYVESIFTGAEGMSTFVQFRYTWLISNNVLEIKSGDRFGVFEVKEANEDYLLLYNKDTPINLNQNTVVDLYKDIKFRVADSSTALRFYPIVEKASPGKYEVRGGAYDQSKYKTLIWDAQRFPGFWYALTGGKSSENLAIDQPASSLTNTSKTIEKEKLLYRTSRTNQNYTVFTEKGRKVENGLEYNSSTKTFTKNTTGGYYARLGWFGDQYVAVNGKANKLARLVKEQKKEEKQVLKLGTAWDLGDGYNLTVEALDTKTSPRQAWLSLTRDGRNLDNRVVNEGEIYTYTEKSLKGEPDVPVFATYVESIFTGAEGMSTFVQLRYTWLISNNILEIRAGDIFGIFEVKEANENYLLLYNKDKPISLDQNTVQPLYGDLKFKVADTATALRFYPFVENTIQEASRTQLKAVNTLTTVPATAAPASASVSTPSSVQAAAPAIQATALKTPGNTADPKQWDWIFFAIAGLVITGYLVLRRG